ncbi:hypothetical protein IMSHALPRED_001573 [Imshaugia aleurites]|uniref:Trichothecene 3-O-acetyltransferase-like N-terminal domain-containing protein n=1 Tax=Imshaugia aleurites TaxID=172621 RepID=A0A8H3J2Q7_9LECA|nr:hypothetical protein IMSHALPRED_001573 [Imshaugia aleurites]
MLIIKTLTNGLQRLSASFPWIAGQLVNEGSGQGNSDIFSIRPLKETPRLVVKELAHDSSIPTMDTLKRANFPISMLDESIIAPRKTLPAGESASDPAPVFLIQANFITGGLILTFVGQHNTMDMTGQGNIIHLFSKACRSEPFTDDELLYSNLARRNIIPLLDRSYKPGSELAYQMVQPAPSHPISKESNEHPAPPPPSNCTWTYFTFDPTSLSTLKSLATKSITIPSRYISTDDALSAFIWQSVIRARLTRLSPTSKSTLARAVNVRQYLGISQLYTGLIQNMTYSTYTLQELAEEPLGLIASQLRSALDPKTSNLEYNTRALATVLDRATDKNIVNFTATIDLSEDLMLSSWAKLNCYELDFNLGLGKPEAVRRPRFEPVESLVYLMPRALDGEIGVAICLRDDDLERLRADKDFARYGKYVG